MEKSVEATKKTTPPPQFKRKARIGLNILDLETGVPVFLEIKSFKMWEKKDGDQIPYWEVNNLTTGEEQMMWLDGGIKGQLSQKGGYSGAVGLSLEITKTGQQEMQQLIEGKLMDVKINTYDIFELDLFS